MVALNREQSRSREQFLFLSFLVMPEPAYFYFGVNAGSSEIDSLGSPEPFCFGVNAGSSEIDSLGSISPAIEDDTVNIKTKATEV